VKPKVLYACFPVCNLNDFFTFFNLFPVVSIKTYGLLILIIKQKKERAEIHWGDEMGLCNESYHGSSYAPRGQTPAIRLHPLA
jgi:hypothetical protein